MSDQNIGATFFVGPTVSQPHGALGPTVIRSTAGCYVLEIDQRNDPHTLKEIPGASMYVRKSGVGSIPFSVVILNSEECIRLAALFLRLAGEVHDG